MHFFSPLTEDGEKGTQMEKQRKRRLHREEDQERRMKRLRSVFLRTIAWLLVFVVGVCVVVSSSSVVALSSSSSSLPRRALQQTTEETEDENKTYIGMYVMIPFVCGLVGYATNVLALKMTFYPLEFYPRCLKFAQVPGLSLIHI